MNSIVDRRRTTDLPAVPGITNLAILLVIVTLGASVFALSLRAQSAGDPAAEFRRLAQELSAARLAGNGETSPPLEKALNYLDTVALAVLNVPAEPNLDTANRALEALVSHNPSVGENYRLVKLGGSPPVYALAVNLGQGGPAAVRVYAGAPGHLALAARIDHFAVKDFFDSDMELVPVSNSDPVFLTISGRTDDLSTGLFAAWRLDGQRLVPLWNSDLVQQSSYESDGNGFHIAYCSKVDDDRPSQCLKMSRDAYQYRAGEWKRTETEEMPAPKPSAK